MDKQKVAIEDFAKIKKLGSLTLSPSGKKAAFTVTEGSLEDNGYHTDIWVYDEAHTPALYRLTAGEDGKAPVFLDEDTLLFPGDRKKRHTGNAAEKETVYNRIPLNGGEAEPFLVLPFIASGLTPVSDGVYLVSGMRDLSAPDLSGLDEAEKAKKLKELEEEKDYEVFDELPFWINGRGVTNKKRQGLYLINTATGENTLLSEGKFFDLHGFTLDENHTKVAYWGNEFESLNTQKARLFVYSLADGSRGEVPLENRYRVGNAQFVEGKLVFTGTTGEKYGSSENPAFYLCADDLSFTLLAAPDPSFGGVGSDIAGGGDSTSGGDGFYYVETKGYHSVYSKLTLDGKIETVADDINIISNARGKAPLVFFIGMEKDSPQELYVKKDGRVEKVSAFNEEYMDTHEVAHTEHFTFIDSDGVEIDGWVLYPGDFDPEKTYPAIFDVHGGPQSAYGEGFFHEMQYWAGLGYIVFFCNPRGSSGKGGGFADIYGDNYGVRDYNDLMEFTDEVLKRVPQIDEKRVAMTGGSYGGFMANWIIGHTDRFAAVASQRSISNYISKCLTTDIGYYHNLSAIQADPWSSPEKMWAHSPLAYADKAKTPTLFIQSDEDYRCWMGDAVQMLQALLMHGVPARMCLFHGENHELSRSGKPRHRVRRLKEITSWFDEWLHRCE